MSHESKQGRESMMTRQQAMAVLAWAAVCRSEGIDGTDYLGQEDGEVARAAQERMVDQAMREYPDLAERFSYLKPKR